MPCQTIAPLRARVDSVVARALAGLPHGLLRILVGPRVTIDGQVLHVEVQLALRLLALAGGPPLETLGVAEARAQIARDARTFEAPRLQVAHIEEVNVSGAKGPRAARLYVPDGTAEHGSLLVYFHGGGFVVCDLGTHDSVCRFLAREAGTRALAVDYRRAPEYRFPAAIDDAFAAFRFAVDHASELGADPARVAVGGDSAGGKPRHRCCPTRRGRGQSGAGVPAPVLPVGRPVYQARVLPVRRPVLPHRSPT